MPVPGLFETAEPAPPPVSAHRARKRAWLVALLISTVCRICPAPAGESCDQLHDDDEILVQLDRDPAVFAHLPRIMQVIAKRPTIRRLVAAQFPPDDPSLPYLTGERT